MLEVYNHQPKSGVCSYIALPIVDSQQLLDMAKDFLCNAEIIINGKIGFSRLHPDDKNYKKSTGRMVATDNAVDGAFRLVEMGKREFGRTVFVFEHVENKICVLALASYKKRPHLVFP